MLETGSPEYAVTRNYLDWMTLLPWGVIPQDKLDLKRARRVLDRDHYGLEDVKERILEFLAVGILKGEVAGSIILLVGPPGVGKTSIGRSIADALGRQFYRFSVGGMRDEAEIKGHRRTYIGAMPGKFIQAIKDAGTANPVIMLDEIDKIGASYQGDPASALLEVLDPEQNVDFLDHYLDLRFDLSKVLFICTANQLDTIPGPLLDRMEVIRSPATSPRRSSRSPGSTCCRASSSAPGWPRARSSSTPRPCARSSTAMRAKPACGVWRSSSARSCARRRCRILEGRARPRSTSARTTSRTISAARSSATSASSPGPAWSPGSPGPRWAGRPCRSRRCAIHEADRGFKLTGQLGDVMKESAEIAYSYRPGPRRASSASTPGFFDEAFIHLHVPAGATPKDGPSAGITMASALLSLARNRPVRRIAMTGELTLTGEVFPIGGIREKLIAARRAGIKEIILPEDNRGDYDEVPEHVRKGLRSTSPRASRTWRGNCFDAEVRPEGVGRV